MSYKDIANAAEVVLVPKGDDMAPCISAFQDYADIEVPPFVRKQYEAKSQGRTFWLVKGIDIPGFISAGLGDIGITGTDACMEYEEQRAIRYRRIGNQMCRFSILANGRAFNGVQALLEQKRVGNKALLSLPTSRPNMLRRLAAWQSLPVAPLQLPVNGSGEAMPKLTGIGAVAELIDTGVTANDNGLKVVKKLCFVFPELVTSAVI